MKQIQLHPSGFAIVDDRDFDWINSFYWERHRQGYARQTKGMKPRQLMHRLIMGAKSGQFVDHINQDKADNRRSNLRLCTASQNAGNQKPHSGRLYKGVYWCERNWQAAIVDDGKRRALGRFNDPVEAARAYNAAALEKWGEFAYLNSV